MKKKINILSNDIKVVNSSEAQLPVLQIAGVDDYFSGFFYRTFGLHGGPNIRRALARSLTPRICTILLAHNPAEFYEVRDSIDIDVQFSGHTMAGQWFPFNILLYPMYPYFHGLYSHTKKKKILPLNFLEMKNLKTVLMIKLPVTSQFFMFQVEQDIGVLLFEFSLLPR